MKFIAHRGLVDGPNPELENRPEHVIKTLDAYDCEVDLWHHNGDLYLGHDAPTYPIDPSFLNQFGLWIHAKNLAAFRYLLDTGTNYFWHESDAYTLTSRGYIWTYPGRDLTQRSVMVMPEHVNPTLANCRNIDCFAICTDYVKTVQSFYK